MTTLAFSRSARLRSASTAAKSPFDTWLMQTVGLVLGPAGVLTVAVASGLVPVAFAQTLGQLALVAALRATDVCLGVFKVTFTVSGRRLAAGAAAAAEAAVWLMAAGIVLQGLSPERIAAYAIGVGMGTVLGMSIVRALRLGTVTVRAFVPVADRSSAGEELAMAFRAQGVGATVFRGQGRDGEVDLVLSVVRRREATTLSKIATGMDRRITIAFDNDPAPGSVVAGRA